MKFLLGFLLATFSIIAAQDPVTACKSVCMDGYRACANQCYISCGCPNGCADTTAHSTCWSTCSTSCMQVESCCEDKCWGNSCSRASAKNVSPDISNSTEGKI